MTDRNLTAAEHQRIDELLERWLRRCRVALSAYNDATTRSVSAERRLGIPAVVLSAVVATSVFATLESDPATGLRIVTGALALGAAVLAALQTFLRQEERAEQFREAARSYGQLRRRIEAAKLFPPQTTEQAKALVDELTEALAEAGRGKPNVPQAVWDRAELKVTGASDARGVRAWRLRLRERLDFGMATRRRLLPELHHLCFADLEAAEVVPLTRLRPGRQPSRASVAVARERMLEAAAGKRDRRLPLTVRKDLDDDLVVIDGNATLGAARAAGWSAIPVRILDSREA